MAIGTAWADGVWNDAAWAVGVWSAGNNPSASLAGFSVTEDSIVSGGDTLVISLNNDTWLAAGASFNAQRQAIINGITSAQSEATGWNAEVRDNEVVGAVVRTSDTVVTITLTAQAAYDITADESITVTVPAAALVTSVNPLVAPPPAIVQANVGEEAGASGMASDDWYRRRRVLRRRGRIGIVE